MRLPQPSPSPQPPAAPAPVPAPAPPAAVQVVTLQPAGAGPFDVVLPPPRTGQELAAIRAQRSELSNQLISANNRREELARELRREGVTGADRAGLEERIRLLDQRILRLEADIAITGRQITTAPASLFASARVSETFGGLPPGGIIGIGVVFTLFVLAPLAIAAARGMWRRASRPAPDTSRGWEHSPRLERLETAVDAIAVEMERVSEGQRFVSKLLAESHGAPQLAAAEARQFAPADPARDRG